MKRRFVFPHFRRTRSFFVSMVRDESGVEVIEFAISATILFTLIFGFMTACIVYYMQNTAAYTAREATRWASVRGASCKTVSSTGMSVCNATSADISAFVTGGTASDSTTLVGLPGAASATVTVQWCNSSGTSCSTTGSNAQGNVVQVTVAFPVSLMTMFGVNNMSVNSTSQSIIWQ